MSGSSISAGSLYSVLDPEMLIVTARHEGERAGCLVSFATQCTIVPPSLLVAISVLNYTFEVARKATSLGVHVLSGEQHDLARLFGSESGDATDKFSRCAWHTGTMGAPILDDCPAWIEGRIEKIVPFGDHVGFQLRVVDGGGELLVPPLRLSAIDFAAGHPAEEFEAQDSRDR